MRRRLALLLLTCLAAPAPALALAAGGDPKERLTAADQTRARTLVLAQGDFGPGWKRTRSPQQEDESLRCPGFEPDLSDLTVTGEAESEFAHSGGGFVGSFSSLMRSPQEAAASWARTVKPGLVRCLASFFRQGVAQEGATARIVRQGAVAFPRVAPRTAAFRIVARIGLPVTEETVPFVVDLVVLGRGRADVGLMAIAPGKGTPAADLRALARTLATKLERSGA